jgi:hypothetical protein
MSPSVWALIYASSSISKRRNPVTLGKDGRLTHVEYVKEIASPGP